MLAFAGTGWDFRAVPAASSLPSVRARPASRDAARLASERQHLELALHDKVPRGTWIVIDQTHNRLRLMHE